MIRRMKIMALLFALVLCVGIVTPVQAGPITIGDPYWYEFTFDGAGTWAEGATSTAVPSSGGNSQYADDPAWTFTGEGVLTVVDAFLSVDQFAIYDFGVWIGDTSTPTEGSSGISDPEVALLDSNYSRGYFTFGAGDHSITIWQLAGISGAAYFRVNEVPEPATLLLFGFGLLSLAGLRCKE